MPCLETRTVRLNWKSSGTLREPKMAGKKVLVPGMQNVEGASVFWIRQQAAIGGEEEAVEYWQTKHDKTRRGIVEVIGND